MIIVASIIVASPLSLILIVLEIISPLSGDPSQQNELFLMLPLSIIVVRIAAPLLVEWVEDMARQLEVYGKSCVVTVAWRRKAIRRGVSIARFYATCLWLVMPANVARRQLHQRVRGRFVWHYFLFGMKFLVWVVGLFYVVQSISNSALATSGPVARSILGDRDALDGLVLFSVASISLLLMSDALSWLRLSTSRSSIASNVHVSIVTAILILLSAEVGYVESFLGAPISWASSETSEALLGGLALGVTGALLFDVAQASSAALLRLIRLADKSNGEVARINYQGLGSTAGIVRLCNYNACGLLVSEHHLYLPALKTHPDVLMASLERELTRVLPDGARASFNLDWWHRSGEQAGTNHVSVLRAASWLISIERDQSRIGTDLAALDVVRRNCRTQVPRTWRWGRTWPSEGYAFVTQLRFVETSEDQQTVAALRKHTWNRGPLERVLLVLPKSSTELWTFGLCGGILSFSIRAFARATE